MTNVNRSFVKFYKIENDTLVILRVFTTKENLWNGEKEQR